MKFKTLILLLLVVVLPTALLSWGGLQLARQQSGQHESQVKGLMRDQLVELDSRIKRYFTVQEAFLQKTASSPMGSIDEIRDTVDSTGVIDNIFIITVDDVLAYPNPISPLNKRELEFYGRIKTIVDDGEIQNRVLQAAGQSLNPQNTEDDNASENLQSDEEQSEQQEAGNNLGVPISGQSNIDVPQQVTQGRAQVLSPQQSSPRSKNSQADPNDQQLETGDPEEKTYEVCEGWFIWYWGRGVNLIFWQRLATGNVVCVALERSRWMSDLIAELPDSVGTIDESDSKKLRSTKIVNSNGDNVYQWGSDVSEEMVLAAEVPVSHPLTSWKLQMWVMAGELKSQSLVGVNIVLGIVASSIALIAVAWIFFREYAKDLEEASKRVSFVNQVSHELRTPLTNIRMYAELLKKEISELDGVDAEQARKRIDVVESESTRLSRLIGNVLSFAGSQKNNLQVRPSNGVIDECVESILSSFAPNLERLGIEIRTDLQATEEVKFDSDILGQIIGNLISNVEKYACDGNFIELTTRIEGKQAVVTIADDGLGIDPKYAQKVFEPFWRMSNKLQHASGTGIGLSISRELARMHGGDLALESSDCGARFVIRIAIEKE